MSKDFPYTIRQLAGSDILLLRALLSEFGRAFDDTEMYTAAQPGNVYLEELLCGNSFIALAALQSDTVLGGLAAYELRKFESERSEIYIYDLAVAADYWRKGIATRLIEHLKPIARSRGAHAMFVQADLTDPPAIQLYSNLGTREDVLHFDIDVD